MPKNRPLKLLYCPRCGTPLQMNGYRNLDCPSCGAGYDLDEVDYADQETVHYLEVPVAPDPDLEAGFSTLRLLDSQYVYYERHTGGLVDRFTDWR